MSLRKKVIHAMCLEYRPDYDTIKLDSDPSWLYGITQKERRQLWRVMSTIYDEDLAELLASMPK